MFISLILFTVGMHVYCDVVHGGYAVDLKEMEDKCD